MANSWFYDPYKWSSNLVLRAYRSRYSNLIVTHFKWCSVIIWKKFTEPNPTISTISIYTLPESKVLKLFVNLTYARGRDFLCRKISISDRSGLDFLPLHVVPFVAESQYYILIFQESFLCKLLVSQPKV